MSVALPALEPRPRGEEDAAPLERSRLSAVVAILAAAVFGASVAAAHVLVGGHGSAAPVTAVRVPAAGAFEHALGPARSGRVLRVQCAGGTPASPTVCFTALP